MRRAARHFSLLIAGASLAGCAASPATSAGAAATQVSSASVQPSASKAAASAISTPSRNAASSAADTAGPLGVLPLPPQSTPWSDNSRTPMGLAAFIGQFYVSSAQADEKRLYARRGFKSGIIEGWFNADQTQQSIAIARFSGVTGATSAFDDLANSLREKKAHWKALTDSADGAVGTVNPQLDPEGNAFVDIAARVGDDVIDVHEYSAATPDPVAAKALLARQVKALKSMA